MMEVTVYIEGTKIYFRDRDGYPLPEGVHDITIVGAVVTNPVQEAQIEP